MPITTTIPTKLKLRQVSASSKVDFDSDTVTCLLVTAGTGAPDTSKTGIEFVGDVISGGNTEVTGTGYSRQTTASPVVAADGSSTTAIDYSFNQVTFSQNAAGPTNIRYAIFADTTIGSSDATNPVVAVCDLGSTQSLRSGDLILSLGTTGLIQWS